MSLFPANVDYTQRDKRSILLRLQGLIRSVFPDWTDFNNAGFDNILLESFAYNGDILAFYQDNQARELFWPTVSQRINAIRLGRLINYRMASARPATTTIRFSLPSVPAVEVPIPQGTIVRTTAPSSIPYRTIPVPDSGTGVAVIPTDAPFVDVAAEQAEYIQGEAFPAASSPNRRLQLTQSPYIDDTAEVTVAGELYTEVRSFLDADPDTAGLPIGPKSKVYVVLTDPYDRAIILFGNGKAGKVPESSINVNYKIGGGTIGNVDAGDIKVIDGTIFDAGSQVAPVTARNIEDASGGINRTTVLQARAQGPQSLRVLERCVTKEDFEITAREVPGVVRSVMVTSNEDGGVQENAGILLAVASGERLESGRIAPATPSSVMLSQIYTKVTEEKPHTLTFTLQVSAAPFRAIDISTRVYVASGYDAEDVGDAVRNSIKDFFAALLEDGTENPAIDFGANIRQADGTVISEIAWSDVFNAVNDTDGVRKVDEGSQGLLLNLLRSSVTLGPRDFPVVGTIQVIDADTGSGI